MKIFYDSNSMAENTTSDDSNKENDCVAILASLSADSAHAPSPIRVADANVLRTPPPTPGKRQGTPTTVISSIPCRVPPGNAIEIVCSFDRFLFSVFAASPVVTGGALSAA
jgi:hypothetical protein